MAVFQAARPGSSALSARGVRIAGLTARPTARTFVRPRLIAEATAAVPRIRPAALLIVAVLVAAALGFAYLTQSLTSTATQVEIARLRSSQGNLQKLITTSTAIVESSASETNIRERANALHYVELRPMSSRKR